MEIRNPHIARMATGILEEDQFLLRFSKYLYITIHRSANSYWEHVRLRESIEVLFDDLKSPIGNGGLDDAQGVNGSHFPYDCEPDNQPLREALQSLTPKQRDVLERRYFKNQSISQIAAECEIAPVTVYDRLTRAVIALRKYLQAEGVTK